MKKIVFETDKILHLVVSFILAMLIAMLMRKCGNTKLDAALAGWFMAFLFAIGKEIYDGIMKGGCEVRDWLADIIGFTVGSLVVYLLML